MKNMRFAFWIGLMLLVSCDEVTEIYPDEPVVDYQSFGIFITDDALGNRVISVRITFEFTDGDGDLGLLPLLEENSDPSAPDSVKYNFFLQLFDFQGFGFVKIPESEGGILKYRIPYLDKQPLKGTIDLDIAYPVIEPHDTIFYTFYIVDRSFNRSNTDTTDVIVLSGIDLDSIQPVAGL